MALTVGKNTTRHEELKEHPYLLWNIKFLNASPNIIVVLGSIRTRCSTSKSFFCNLWPRCCTPNGSSGAFFKSFQAKCPYFLRVY